jgi:hypothetical protein
MKRKIRHREPGIVLSDERKAYHVFLEQFVAKYIEGGEDVYDIGISERFDYAPMFSVCEYKTIDKREVVGNGVRPDSVVDIALLGWQENSDVVTAAFLLEQTLNPEEVVRRIWKMLKPNGLAVFAILLTGYPGYEDCYTLMTETGARKLLEGFAMRESNIVERNGKPSALLAVVAK